MPLFCTALSHSALDVTTSSVINVNQGPPRVGVLSFTSLQRISFLQNSRLAVALAHDGGADFSDSLHRPSSLLDKVYEVVCEGPFLPHRTVLFLAIAFVLVFYFAAFVRWITFLSSGFFFF